MKVLVEVLTGARKLGIHRFHILSSYCRIDSTFSLYT